jgi:hypothetical protein
MGTAPYKPVLDHSAAAFWCRLFTVVAARVIRVPVCIDQVHTSVRHTCSTVEDGVVALGGIAELGGSDKIVRIPPAGSTALQRKRRKPGRIAWGRKSVRAREREGGH